MKRTGIVVAGLYSVIATAPLSADMEAGLNFWFFNPNVLSFSAECAGGRINVPDDLNRPDAWNPDMLEDIAPFSTLRFMDWGFTNTNDETSWDERTRIDECLGWGTPVAFEWMIGLCNASLKHLWINVPHAADENYQRQLARLIRDSLDPRLTVYLEYSNETWNAVSHGKDYCISMGESLGLGEGFGAGVAYHAYACGRLWQVFDEEFAEQKHRLARVLGGIAYAPGVSEAMLDFMRQPEYNPAGIKVDAVAIAPYFNTEHGAGIDGLRQSIRQTIEWCAEQKDVCERYGAELLCYEGGADLWGAPNETKLPLTQDPRMENLYREYFDGMAPYVSLFTQYTLYDNWNEHGGCWGLKSYPGQPEAEAPKYRGAAAWAREHPCSQPTGVRTAAYHRPGAVSPPRNRMQPDGQLFDVQGRLLGSRATVHRLSPGLCLRRSAGGVVQAVPGHAVDRQ